MNPNKKLEMVDVEPYDLINFGSNPKFPSPAEDQKQKEKLSEKKDEEQK